ncbi:Oleoyl-acyl carrier protein thioesterase protein [Thalictrum thalictroides]|uniref:Acyl-[acyl-carrier-protein] hydrolase n=1 Tax=Thalictrum thalictroides TaxID=46969 RepID=A0A7J6WDK4_THATH|nr:Oleoyl-acyl carrier protein thioesterase protein [Thalictrum thalictroides]
MEKQLLLKSSYYNAADLYKITHYPRFLSLKTPRYRLNNGGGVFFSCSSSSIPLDLAVSKPVETRSSNVSMGSLADKFRHGSLSDDGLSYKEKFIVRCYEVGINKTATVETIANLLQENACNHAQSVGFSTDGFATTPTMRKLRLIWVTSRMHIEVYKYPAWGDVVEIETWCQSEGRIGTRRDWIIKDVATDAVIGRATSKWVTMNQDTRKLQKVNDEVREEYLVFCPRTPRLSFPEADSSSLKKIPRLEDPARYSKLGLAPRRADLDMNQHVNNVTYIGWVLESIPQEIIETHELEKITLDYRRECQQDDMVESLASPEVEDLEHINNQGTNGSSLTKRYEQDWKQFLHFLKLSGSGLEINRGRTEWRRKLTR